MAEARRLEEDEEELKELGRRHHRRGNLNPAADRSERSKSDHRSSGTRGWKYSHACATKPCYLGLNPVVSPYCSSPIESTPESQGPLSSIKAAIKRTSRTSGHSEQQRERRRPEITIVAAEPLGPTSWFPGRNRIPQQGLVWRTNELVPAEPPSYEQVIKEINQVQVNTTTNNNAASTAYSRNTATSSTQTDFPEEIISCLPGINVKNNLHALSEHNNTPAVQIPRKPPRPSSSLLNSNHPINAELLVVLEDQSSQETPNAVIHPVPKPRSKGNLKPIVRDTQNNTKGNQEETRQSETEKDTPSIHLVSLLDDDFWDSHMVMEDMDMDKTESSIVSRIKAFESQTSTETSGLTKKPEVSPRSLGPKPVVSAKKPVVAPKPGANRTSGEWNSWTENRLKAISQERPLLLQDTGNNVITKPELPKKPKPVIAKSSSNGVLNPGGRPASESSEGQRKSPVPTPRPLVPKKSVSFESPALPLLPLKPVCATPKLSVAAQTSAFRSQAETPGSGLSTAPVQSALSIEGDLINFDDDFLPVNSEATLQELTQSESDLFNLASKPEPVKEPVVQPAVARKPTVIRIPSKSAKVLNEAIESPPPLPTEKPIGNTSGISAGKLDNIKITKKVESDYSNLTQLYKNEPFMPPRPDEGKVVPARPPPPKGAPGRPPPPKSTKSSSQNDRFSRSVSDMALHKKSSQFGLEAKRTKNEVIKNLDPALPPRPKPGHPLYNKYMLPVPHGIAKEDIPPQSTGHLSCKQGDVLVLMDKIDNSCVECQKGEEKGKVPLSQMQIITPLEERLKSRQKDSDQMRNVSDPSVPHAKVLHNFIAEETGDLNLNSGEIVYLLEKIDDEWYRGKCRNHTGIFPASFVKVIVDIPGENNRRKVHFSSPSIVGPRCIARFEYIGDLKDELSFAEGELIILKEYVSEEWAKGELRGTSGIFPLNFVEIIEDLPEPGGGAPLKNKNSAPVKELDGQTGEWCDALHDFTAETQEDLSFRKGDRILILERLDSEWCRGRLNGKEGIFPAVYVQLCSGVRVSEPPNGKKGKAKALYDFHAENVDELSFKVGDIITELELLDEEWLSGKLRGKSGIFPKNFVQILELS